ncbi:MAG: pseudaminic acid biosynthesis-associated methylase [Acidimicrobiia bacterium]
MTTSEPPEARTSEAEAHRLEALWAGGFGDDYVQRNADAAAVRGPFWNGLLDRIECERVLEVGCNLGANLRWIAPRLDPVHVFGIDVNRTALGAVRSALPEVNSVWSPARSLPFRDGFFDLVFTMGVLIHQPEESLPDVMDEMVRCSSRWVLCGEYHADETVEVPYRGESGALFKRDYRRLFLDRFPALAVVDEGFLGRDEGWDDITWQLFERRR